MINNLLEKRKFHRCNECKIIDNEFHCANELKVYTGELQELKWAYENELAEKDEYINFLENRPGNHDCKNCPNRNNELEQKLLIVDLIKTYKYEIIKYQRSQYNGNKTIEIGMLKFVIKDLEKLFGIQNHKLPSKEEE